MLKLLPLFFALSLVGCQRQSPADAVPAKQPAQVKSTVLVGGGCDGCELMFVGIPENIKAVDTSAAWREEGQKLLVKGTVFKKDGTTPAPGVILYYWHTDNEGYYSPRPGMDKRAERHGHIRGWLKTGADGKYALYTIRPAPYPNEDMPAHMHPSIKEPGLNEYYIDEFVFDDDPLLTPAKRKALENRGGSGIMKVTIANGMQVAERDIILGRNIPDYP
jgi:protocatechuate 3,4-dioxygenase beta subunit